MFQSTIPGKQFRLPLFLVGRLVLRTVAAATYNDVAVVGHVGTVLPLFHVALLVTFIREPVKEGILTKI